MPVQRRMNAAVPQKSMCRPAIELLLLFGLALSAMNHPIFARQLRCVTANIWSGVDYRGKFSVGEYETAVAHEARIRILIDELKSLQPDIISLQEVNPVGSLGSRIAGELNYDWICERVNSGLKIAGIGMPWNLNEGLVILARKELHLEFVDVWNLSGGLGIIGNVASLHWSEQRAALIGRIHYLGLEILVADVHLSSAVPDESCSRFVARQVITTSARDPRDINGCVESYFVEASDRSRSVDRLIEYVNTAGREKPWVIMGDFNAAPSRPEIRKLVDTAQFLDAASIAGVGNRPTWDPEHNSNIRFSEQVVDARGDSLRDQDLLGVWHDGQPRRIDYVFLNRAWQARDVLGAELVFDRSHEGRFASDHYGVLATLDLSRILRDTLAPRGETPSSEKSQFEGLPILSYDTDVGLGYGVKGFFLNFLGATESLDLIAFNSTKGERWYRLVFSIPDFELRQGKLYPLSLDLIVDYDKYLKNNYYGLGQDSRVAMAETYTKEPLDILAVLSRGFNREFVAQLGLRYRVVTNYYNPGSFFERSLPAVNLGRSGACSLYGAVRYDSRDSYINASRGEVAQLELESGGSWLTGDYTISGSTLTLQSYRVLFYPKTVFAARLIGKMVGGSNLPIHVLASVGGNQTVRGYPQDRFLDKVSGVANAEIRFPISWRFGGVFGFDAGRVFGSLSALSLDNWVANPVVGLRLSMDTFVVRADLGFGKETTGFYLNFGQLF